MRLFVACELPQRLRERIAARTLARRERFPPATWVRSENLHLTLAFFGEIGPQRSSSLTARLAAEAAAVEPFEARLERCDAFPARGPLRVVWLGVSPQQPLVELSRRLRRAASEVGVAADDKPFHAHLTLARCRRPWSARERSRVLELSLPETSDFPVAGAALMASELAPAGFRYSAVARLDFGGAA
jgi:RNA 2',3'-cyclic 3'-phosphodiesterase